MMSEDSIRLVKKCEDCKSYISCVSNRAKCDFTHMPLRFFKSKFKAPKLTKEEREILRKNSPEDKKQVRDYFKCFELLRGSHVSKDELPTKKEYDMLIKSMEDSLTILDEKWRSATYQKYKDLKRKLEKLRDS